MVPLTTVMLLPGISLATQRIQAQETRRSFCDPTCRAQPMPHKAGNSALASEDQGERLAVQGTGIAHRDLRDWREQ